MDFFRGLTVAAMILVNNPGDASKVYAPLQHAAWNGWTPTDLIFPFFLFITGAAVPLALAERRGTASSWKLHAHILRRAAIIFGLGLFLNGFPLLEWSTLRIPGVLQRVAICYAVAALLVLHVRPVVIAAVCSIIVAGDSLLIAALPELAGPGGPDVSSLLAVEARWMSGHLLHEAWDPEGLASTLPAVATTLLGVLAGNWLRAARSPAACWQGLLRCGAVCVATSLLLDRWCPINKVLWSGSFVLFSGGAAGLALGVAFRLVEGRQARPWTLPFVAFGANPIVAYVLSTLGAKELWLWQLTGADGSPQPAAQYIFEHVFLPLAQPLDASFLYAVAYTTSWLLVAMALYRQRVLIKI